MKDKITANVWGEKPFEVLGTVELLRIDEKTAVTKEGEPVFISFVGETPVVAAHVVDGKFKGFKYFAHGGGGYYLTKKSEFVIDLI